jgi:hypothetical protein
MYEKSDREENEKNYNEYFENILLDEQEREEEELIQSQFEEFESDEEGFFENEDEEEEEEEVREVLYNEVPYNYDEERVM